MPTPETPVGERMSRIDTAWLRMDNEFNLMLIVGVWLLTPAVPLAAVRERVADKLLQYERFRQRAVPDAFGASWVEDEDFDLAQHVVAARLDPTPGESQRHALQRLCGDLATTPLDPARPLWQFHCIDGYEGGTALVARIHHCIADGIALIGVMMSITDGGSDPPRRSRRAPPRDDGQWLARAVLEPFTGVAVKAIGVSGAGLSRALDAMARPQDGMSGLTAPLELARIGYRVVADALAIAAMPDDSPTRLKGRPEGRKVVAWSEPLALADVKAVGKALGASVNDVLLACAAGAIGGWLQTQGASTAGQEIRAMVPVNLRPPEQAWKLGNRFGLAPLSLPIGVGNPVERVFAVRARMGELKGSYQPLLAFGVLALTGLFIKPVQDAVLNLFSRKTTAVMTNVPGPAQPLQFCGSTLRQMMFWVPSSGEVGVGVSILSYGGGVQFGLVTDRALCPDPQQIIDRFTPEFDKLVWLSLMLPWGADAAG